MTYRQHNANYLSTMTNQCVWGLGNEGEGGTMGVAPAGQTENIREQMTPTTTQANGRTETMILTTVILPRDIKLKDEDTLWTFVCVISSKSESV